MLSHIDSQGQALMVDVSAKEPTERSAAAEGRISISPAVKSALQSGALAKGDALGVARVAGIMAVKRTADIIPLCHPLPISHCQVLLELEDEFVHARCTVKTVAPTGVEMEALTGVAAALLTVYDMCKAVDKGMEIGAIRLISKTGGKNGEYRRP